MPKLEIDVQNVFSYILVSPRHISIPRLDRYIFESYKDLDRFRLLSVIFISYAYSSLQDFVQNASKI